MANGRRVAAETGKEVDKDEDGAIEARLTRRENSSLNFSLQ
jgi:hypothetical protein